MNWVLYSNEYVYTTYTFVITIVQILYMQGSFVFKPLSTTQRYWHMLHFQSGLIGGVHVYRCMIPSTVTTFHPPYRLQQWILKELFRKCWELLTWQQGSGSSWLKWAVCVQVQRYPLHFWQYHRLSQQLQRKGGHRQQAVAKSPWRTAVGTKYSVPH